MCIPVEWYTADWRNRRVFARTVHSAACLKKVIRLSQRRIHYYLTIATFVACGISVIPTFYTVLIGRFSLGSLVSLYLSVSVGYIKETFPSFIRKSLGAIYSTGRVLGIVICYMIAYLSNYSQD